MCQSFEFEILIWPVRRFLEGEESFDTSRHIRRSELFGRRRYASTPAPTDLGASRRFCESSHGAEFNRVTQRRCRYASDLDPLNPTRLLLIWAGRTPRILTSNLKPRQSCPKLQSLACRGLVMHLDRPGGRPLKPKTT
ncbi:hypothetical protein EYF80_045147 [Liparis tanakae]|uniref:Uncharacterized protein n=1 Tax=Liparis tanakae TaxID=230148 RepID=A0A4Z2FUH5_9TELE|nr:hypothetical protein EYF80_045147 [Liparis tanakae]